MNDRRTLPLSVVDLSPVWAGSTSSRSLHQTLDLAVAVEELGYHRFWVAEHHNAPGVASSSPPVLIGQLASATRTIHVGAGGVMLPNHPPLVVAEQFGTLEALHPGRIDLGLGRAPGTDPITARALHRAVGVSGGDFPEQVHELAQYFSTPPSDGPRPRIAAVPAEGNRPRIWLLGSSPNGARVAARLGFPFVYAYHFNPYQVVEALDVYRDEFAPGSASAVPYVIIAVMAITASSDEEAARLAAPIRFATATSLHQGRQEEYRSTKEAAAYQVTDDEARVIDRQLGPQFIGGQERVLAGLNALVAATNPDELMTMTVIEDFDALLRSHTLLRDAVNSILRPR